MRDPGVAIAYSGQFEFIEQADARLIMATLPFVLAGVAAEFGVIMLLYPKQAPPERERRAATVDAAMLEDAIREGALLCERPRAIPSLGWPAMTMGFKVRDPALFDQLVAARRVAFEFVKQADGYVVTAVK